MPLLCTSVPLWFIFLIRVRVARIYITMFGSQLVDNPCTHARPHSFSGTSVPCSIARSKTPTSSGTKAGVVHLIFAGTSRGKANINERARKYEKNRFYSTVGAAALIGPGILGL